MFVYLMHVDLFQAGQMATEAFAWSGPSTFHVLMGGIMMLAMLPSEFYAYGIATYI